MTHDKHTIRFRPLGENVEVKCGSGESVAHEMPRENRGQMPIAELILSRPRGAQGRSLAWVPTSSGGPRPRCHAGSAFDAGWRRFAALAWARRRAAPINCRPIGGDAMLKRGVATHYWTLAGLVMASAAMLLMVGLALWQLVT